MTTFLTIAELQYRTESELRGLFHQASEALACSSAGAPERRNGLASLENISRTLAMKVGARGF